MFVCIPGLYAQEIVVPPEHKGHADAHDAHLQSGSRIGVFSRFKAQPEPDVSHALSLASYALYQYACEYEIAVPLFEQTQRSVHS